MDYTYENIIDASIDKAEHEWFERTHSDKSCNDKPIEECGAWKLLEVKEVTE